MHATGARAAGEPKNGGLRYLSWRAPNVSDGLQQEPNPTAASQANSRRGKVVRNLRIRFATAPEMPVSPWPMMSIAGHPRVEGGARSWEIGGLELCWVAYMKLTRPTPLSCT